MSWIPEEIDEYFLLDVTLIILMLTYNMPLATIYLFIAIIAAFMYYVALDQKLFHPIPMFKNKQNKIGGILMGAGAGVGFLFLYNYLNVQSSVAAVFATTAFGDSEIITKLVYTFLLTALETRFFMGIIMQWLAWKTNTPTSSLFSFGSIQMMIYIGFIFALVHATAKGVTENMALLSTFLFGAISVGLIIYFQEVIQAYIMHVVVNGSGVGLLDSLKSSIFGMSWLSNMWVVGGIAVVGWYLIKTKKIPLRI